MIGDKKGKEVAFIWKDQRGILNKHIDERLDKAGIEFRTHRQNGDTSQMWAVWSKVVERGWLTYLDEGKIFDRKCKVRGEMTIIRSDPKKAKGSKKASDGDRGGYND